MSKNELSIDSIDEILENLTFKVADRHFRRGGLGYAERRKEDDKDLAHAKAQLFQLMLEIIGTTEPDSPNEILKLRLRNEQRQKLWELFGGDK